MTSPAPPPSGFVNRPKPKSMAEAISQNPNDRLKSIAKIALQSYINSFLETSGVNRSLISATSPAGLTFVTDKSLQDNTDPDKRPTQLARFYSEIRQHYPAILLIDAGFQWIPSGLNGGLEAASNVNGKWQGYYRLFGKVPMLISVVTKDQETTDILQNLLLLLFNPFRNISGGSLISSRRPEDSWEVRLPLEMNAGTNTPVNYEGDPKDQLWSSTIDMVLDVEAQLSIETDIFTADVIGAVANSPTFEADYNPIIISPTAVSLRDGLFNIQLSRFDPRFHRLIIDNPDVATLDLSSLTIFPRKVGTFNIKIIDTRKQDVSNEEAPFVWKTITSVQVVVNY